MTGRLIDGAKLSGAAFVLLLAASFAASSAFARVAYDAGSNPLTVSFARVTLAAAAVSIWCSFVGARPMTSRHGLAILLGLLLAGSTLSFSSSFQTLPVATATLVYYTFPLTTGLMLAAAGRKDSHFGGRDVLALVLAFAGLSVALWSGTGFGRDAILGIAQAATGATGFALFLTLTRLFFDAQEDARSRILLMLVVAALGFAVFGTAANGFAWPVGRDGVAALCATSVCYTFAIVGTLVATDRIGPLPVAILLNFEPVVSLLLGHAMLGQVPTVLQVTGSLVVVAAILLHLLRRSAVDSGERRP